MQERNNDGLALGNQLCFSLYAASRMVTRLYQPLLKDLGLTYPQYIVLLVLWKNDGCPVSVLTEQTRLNTNTMTPLLKRLEQMQVVTRERNPKDERQCLIRLTDKGWELRNECACIPREMLMRAGLAPEKAMELKAQIDDLLLRLDKGE